MINNIYLVGAYGRIYTTKELMVKDWVDGKDFRLENGQYISIRDMHFVDILTTVYLIWHSEDFKQKDFINVREI